jgi:hypothetical protein
MSGGSDDEATGLVLRAMLDAVLDMLLAREAAAYANRVSYKAGTLLSALATRCSYSGGRTE